MFSLLSTFALVVRWIVSARLFKEITTGKDGRALHLNPEAQTSNNGNMPEELKQVADLVTANTIFCTKEVLTSDEAAKYMGVSKSYLYKLTMRQQIPHFKPMGKMCYFNRLELEKWLQRNRVSTATEISQQAQDYCIKHEYKRK